MKVQTFILGEKGQQASNKQMPKSRGPLEHSISLPASIYGRFSVRECTSEALTVIDEAIHPKALNARSQWKLARCLMKCPKEF